MTDLSGQYLGRYYLAEQLGEGGMAVVYKAYDTRLERDVAIKIIRSAAFPPEQLDQILKRFEREAKSLAKLSHPNIVKVHDFGEHEASPFLVMEYLPGGTLKKFLGQPVLWQDAVRLLLPIARGVAYAHRHGILHRDIKPANILITESGESMLSDFGIAKLFEADQSTVLTGSGVAIGTPEYMAPEQWTGVTSPQSDLYSLGIVLYELVAGRKPYVADTPGAILIKQVTEPLPAPRKFVAEIPETVEHVLIKALAREAADRYEDVNAFVGALESLQTGAPVVLPESQSAEATSQIAENKPGTSVPVEATGEEAADGRMTRPGEVEEPQPVKVRDEKNQRPVRFSWRGAGILIGGIVVVLVIWLGLPSLGKLFGPAPVVTESLTPTLQPIVESQMFEPTQTHEIPTLGVTPTDTVVLTSTEYPVEIRDDKGVAMVLVPEGEFTMGSDNEDPDEKPVHQVLLDGYYIDKYEVTNALYKECVIAGKCKPPTETSKYNSSQYAQHPVVYVDWDMANTYCGWRGARLPSEAEWEKSARGTDGRTYPWGDEIYVTYANYNGNIGDTTMIGDYLTGVSPYGAYDMAGNVWEWVADWYDERYYQVSPSANPAGPDTGIYRVLRGGSWYFDFYNTRSTLRYRNIPSHVNFDIGFRCALSADTAASPIKATPTPEPGFTIVDPQEVLNIAPRLGTLGQLAVEKYSTEDRNRINSTLTFTINSTPDVPILWRWFWCAVNDEVLEQNMTKISLIFDANGYVIPKEQLATVVFENADAAYKGWKCRTYETVLRDWKPGTYKLIQTTTLSSAINDGRDTFEAGYKIYEYTVIISP
jgi:formylglycine-generating enzyme required for sulfatase activity/tRNA A-37 threonylcarbamoyl transferase component Bud32